MGYQLGIPDALKKRGLKVEVVDGWETRGHSSFNPGGAVGHHTAGPKTGDRPSLAVVVNGRPDLNGPLANVFLDRQGIAVVVAAGRANHAGEGGYRGLVGNSSVFGTEAEDDGDGIWTDAQLVAYPKVQAALLDLAGKDETWYCSHRTWAPSRKIDPSGISDSWMQSQIKAVRLGPPPEEEDFDMFIAWHNHQPYLVTVAGKRTITPAAKDELKDKFQKVGKTLVDIGDVSSATLGEFPTFREDGTDAGSTYNDLRAVVSNTEQLLEIAETPTP